MKKPAPTVLLLNASNMESYPIYPYAFIQVPAIARQAGIEVVCKDMLGIPQETWKQSFQKWIEQHLPTMILITLRNTDSLNSGDYEVEALKAAGKRGYFPIERTKELITAIREVTDLKIILGGFAFSLLPTELMNYLRPDYGVVGDPDDFFAHFEQVQNGDADQVANLMFFREERLVTNPRRLFPPFTGTEYTPQAIRAMMNFYAAFPAPGFQGAPLEIMRGCNHSCVFCAEPHVKGTTVRYRDLHLLMDDIQILVEQGITQLYIISSELNPEGNEFILDLADRIFVFNEKQTPDRKVSWYGANYLLKFNPLDYERLYRSGFTGGWFDVTALDDENARAMRTPYRNASLLSHLKAYAHDENRRKASASWTMFLGNPATTLKTIRNTLQTADREGLADLFDSCGVDPNMRVFDYEGLSDTTLPATYSVNPDLMRSGYQQLLPSFAYPPALLSIFSEQEIMDLFDHLGQTYLSTKYQTTRDWNNFLRQNASLLMISTWFADLPELQEVKFASTSKPGTNQTPLAFLHKLFSEELLNEKQDQDHAHAKRLVELLLGVGLKSSPDLFMSLGLPGSYDQLARMTPYQLAVRIFSRWNTEQELFEELARQTDIIRPSAPNDFYIFCIKIMLYQYNIQINTSYSILFVSR